MTCEEVKTTCSCAIKEESLARDKYTEAGLRSSYGLCGVTWALCAIAKAIVCAGREIACAIRERKP